MSNTIFLLLHILLSQPVLQDSTVNLYDLQFNSIDSVTINMSDYQNKHVLIVEFDATNPDRVSLLALDSLYKSDTAHIGIVAVPALDFGGITDIAALKMLLHDTLGISFTIADTGYAKKEAGLSQHILMKWATNRSENGHIDNDITEAGQFYLISTKGLLYGSLVKENVNDMGLITNLINNEPLE